MAERSAPNFVTFTTAVQLKIKEIITQDLTRSVDKQTTFKKLKRIIQAFGQSIKDEYVRQKFESSLARGAVKIYDQTSARLENIAIALAVPLVALISFVSGETSNQTNRTVKPVPPILHGNGAASQEAAREYLFEDRIERFLTCEIKLSPKLNGLCLISPMRI